MSPRRLIAAVRGVEPSPVTRAMVWLTLVAVAAISLDHLVRVAYAGMHGDPGRIGLDYRAFVAAGDLVRSGRGDLIYQPATAEFLQLAQVGFVYPPWAALAMIPWTFLPTLPGLALWTLAGLGIMVAGLRSCGVTEWRPVAVAMISFPSAVALGLGQSTFLLVGVVAFVIGAMLRDNQRASGGWLSAAGWKPHLLAGFALLWVADPRRWRRQIAWAATTTASLVVISELAIAGSWVSWLRFLAGSVNDLASPALEASLPGMVALLIGSEGAIRWIVFTGVVAIGIPLSVATLRIRAGAGPSVQHIALALTAGLLFMPHVVIYDVLILMIPLAMLASTPFHRDVTMIGLVLALGLSTGPFVAAVQFDLWGRALDLSTLSLVFAAAIFGFWVRTGEPFLPPVAADHGIAATDRDPST